MLLIRFLVTTLQARIARFFTAALLGSLIFLFSLGASTLLASPAIANDLSFEQILVDDSLQDGYWIEAFDVNNDSRTDLVTSGLALGQVVWYENPGDLTPKSRWEKHPIITLSKPVAMDHADIDGDGWIDIVISHDYGNCMFNCGPNDGKISWLKNPGGSHTWTQYHIGDLVATHRLVLGKFSSIDELQLLALPVVGTHGWDSAINVTLYSKPTNLYDASSWNGEIIDDSYFHVIHDFRLSKFDANTNSNFDSVVLASQEGVSWLYYGQDNEWHIIPLGIGELSQKVTPSTKNNDHQFTGSGNVDIGKIGDDLFAYIATVEPFHGNTVSIYTKNVNADLAKLQWDRTIVDLFGYPNKNGESAGHHVKTVDFDKDGNDEFIVAERGPKPWEGVFYYKLVNHKGDIRPSTTFERTQVSSSSAARIAVGDFDGDGWLDFATTGYYTPGYFLADNPKILVFLNRLGKSVADH